MQMQYSRGARVKEEGRSPYQSEAEHTAAAPTVVEQYFSAGLKEQIDFWPH